MTAKSSGGADLDRRHHLELDEARVPCMEGSICGTGSAKDISDLDRAHQLLRRYGHQLEGARRRIRPQSLILLKPVRHPR